MHYLDIILLVILLISFIFGLRRGLFLSFMQLLGIVIIFVLMRQFGDLIRAGIHERLGLSETVATIIGYILIFIIVMVIASLVSSLMKKLFKLINLGWLDGILGGILGVLFGFFVLVVLVLILEASSLANIMGETRKNSYIYHTANTISRELLLNVVEQMPDGNTQAI